MPLLKLTAPSVLRPDAPEWVCSLLNPSDLACFHISDPSLLNALGQRLESRLITFEDRTYARVGSEFIEIKAEAGSKDTRQPIWRVIDPRNAGGAPNANAPRLVQDKESGMWLKADDLEEVNRRGIQIFRDGRVVPTHGARYGHGSLSASLLAFTDHAGEARGSLLPVGELLSRNMIPFAGELGNSLADRGFSRTRVSCVDLQGRDYLNYAGLDGNRRAWTPQNARDVLESYAGVPDWPGSEGMVRRKLDLANRQLEAWGRLESEEDDLKRTLVTEGFPVVYGIRGQKEDRLAYAGNGEIGISGGVGPDDICVIYVPREKTDDLQKLLDYPTTRHIAVEPIDVLRTSVFE